MTKPTYFSPQSSQLSTGKRQVSKQSQDSMTGVEMEIFATEGTVEQVREDFPEEETREWRLEG